MMLLHRWDPTKELMCYQLGPLNCGNRPNCMHLWYQIKKKKPKQKNFYNLTHKMRANLHELNGLVVFTFVVEFPSRKMRRRWQPSGMNFMMRSEKSDMNPYTWPPAAHSRGQAL